MRTPMNGILGIAGLSTEITESEILQENMKKIRDSGEYLLGLINDTLDFQRIESGKLKLEPQIVDVNSFIANIADMVRSTAEKKKIDFQIVNQGARFDCYVRIDPLRMKQVLVNLLSNAVKFTKENGKVQLIVECLDRTESTVHDKITVCDTGVGMSQEFIDKSLFQPFAQEQNEMSLVYAGSGLGLSIVKSLVELMGATIEVKSTLGKGTTFAIDVTFERVDSSEAVQQLSTKDDHREAVKEKLAGKRLLLCEDHPLNAEIAIKILENAGCLVDWARDGQEGVDSFQASETGYYSAVLMDIRMPRMDGLQAAQAIRGLHRVDAQLIPIIAMTANAYEEDIRRSAKAGMNAHLAKPIEPEKLYEALAEQI